MALWPIKSLVTSALSALVNMFLCLFFLTFRCLLKDFYDITFSCTEDPDMKKFDTASRRFGRKNILNHLSLLDQYFNELQKKLSEWVLYWSFLTCSYFVFLLYRFAIMLAFISSKTYTKKSQNTNYETAILLDDKTIMRMRRV